MFHWPVRVYYEDTDSGGVVYYANYLKYMERARTEWLRGFGIEQDVLLEQHGIIFAVHSVALNFLNPGRFNDLLHVTAELSRQRRASMTFNQEVLRLSSAGADDKPVENTAGKDRTILCAGHVKIACLDADSMRPCHIPDDILMEIACDS
jgi:acyl-CoA thioester hydrolase